MQLLILRHAIAVPRGTPGYPNDDRPLTTDGIEKMKQAARGIAALGLKISVIMSSPLKRAHETAMITAAALRQKEGVRLSNALLPGTSHKTLLGELTKLRNKPSVMIVGHEPDLGLLASRILGAHGSVVEFRKGALCCIEVEDLRLTVPGTLLWHLTPKQLRMLGKKSK